MNNRKISLNGTWKLRWYDGQRGGNVQRLLVADPELHRALPAEVPGEVHLDLLRAGLIEEPAEGLNSLASRWVEELQWFYYRTFEVPALNPGEHAYLSFSAIDLVAVIYLNGKEIGRHANAFYPCRFDVTDFLLEGENVLVVAVEAGLFAVSERPSKGYGIGMDGLLHKRHWQRQVQSSFSWDWAPRLLNVGLRGDVTLEICQSARFDQLVVLSELSNDLLSGRIRVRLFAEGINEGIQNGVLRVEIEETDQRIEIPIEVKPGLHPYEAEIILEAPQLWWPIGYGSQPLYTIQATLTINSTTIGSARKQTAFRHVRVVQDPHPSGGRYFFIEINHKPIFMKGGNWVPADILFARLNRDRYRLLVDRAIEANFNIVRIWGGGMYESEDLYELCDEKGLLVWQEFIFACAKYPLQDEEFAADVKREAVYHIRRLAHHPSLIVWCGNNEMEVGTWDWGYERGVAYPDYALFHLVLPVLLDEEDGTRYYQPSSPFSPEHKHPARDDIGDQHPWSVGFTNTDFRDYRQMISRFPNEGGFLGPTSLPTMRTCLGKMSTKGSPFTSENAAPTSFAFEIHDNSFAYNDTYTHPDHFLLQWLGLRPMEMSLEEFVYYGGLIQGEALSEYIYNFRRRMFSSASAIFWMYNDCWPATRSWTIVDYYGRRTPSFCPVRRAFQPLCVVLAVENNMINVYGVNEGPACQVEIRYGLFHLRGGYPMDRRQTAALPENASTFITSFALEHWYRLGEKTHAAFAILYQDGQELSRNVFMLPFYKEIDWPDVDLQVRLEQGKAIFECSTFAWRVCLDLDGEQSYPDNFFDVLPDIPTTLDWSPDLGEPRVLFVGNSIHKAKG